MNEWFHHKSSFSSHIPSKNAFETGSFVDEKSLKYIEKKKKSMKHQKFHRCTSVNDKLSVFGYRFFNHWKETISTIFKVKLVSGNS